MRPLFLTVPLGLLTAVYVFFIGHFALFRGEYYFGTEVGGVMYRTVWHYLGINFLFFAAGVLAVFATRISGVSKFPTAVRVIAMIVLIGGLVWPALAAK